MCRKAARAGLELLSLAHHDSFVGGVGQKRTSCRTVVFTNTTNEWRSSTLTAACSCLRGHRTDRKPQSTRRPRASTELKKERAVALFCSEREQALFKKARARPQSVLPKKRVGFEKFMVKEKCFVLGMHKLAEVDDLEEELVERKDSQRIFASE